MTVVRLKDFPQYGATPDGQIYSYRTERYLKPILSLGAGYPMVNLKIHGKQHLCYVHRLIATTYIDNPENKNQVNHKNGIKTDNRVENLEWVTPSENITHAYKTGLHKDNISVAMCNSQGMVIRVFNSQGETTKEGFDQRLVSRAIQKGYKHHGYLWKEVVKNEANS